MNMSLLRNQAALQKSVERLNRWQSTSIVQSPSYAVYTNASDPEQFIPANVVLILQWDFLCYNSDTNPDVQTPFSLYSSPTSQIYIPQEGMYSITLVAELGAAELKRCYLYVNGVQSQVLNDAYQNIHVNFTFQRYFDEADIVEIGLFTTTNGIIRINSLNEDNESPILFIKKI